MKVRITKSEFVVQASIQLAAGEAAYGGGGLRADRVVMNAEHLYETLVNEGHIESVDETENIN